MEELYSTIAIYQSFLCWSILLSYNLCVILFIFDLTLWFIFYLLIYNISSITIVVLFLYKRTDEIRTVLLNNWVDSFIHMMFHVFNAIVLMYSNRNKYMNYFLIGCNINAVVSFIVWITCDHCYTVWYLRNENVNNLYIPSV
jgi:hypothetical protein